MSSVKLNVLTLLVAPSIIYTVYYLRRTSVLTITVVIIFSKKLIQKCSLAIPANNN